jgi:hypothetical protein
MSRLLIGMLRRLTETGFFPWLSWLRPFSELDLCFVVFVMSQSDLEYRGSRRMIFGAIVNEESD